MRARPRVVTHCAECVAERSRNTAENAMRRQLRTPHFGKQDGCCQNAANNNCAPAHGRTPKLVATIQTMAVTQRTDRPVSSIRTLTESGGAASSCLKKFRLFFFFCLSNFLELAF